MGVKLRERPGKGWYVLTDYRGQRKAKCFSKNKVLAKEYKEKLEAKLKLGSVGITTKAGVKVEDELPVPHHSGYVAAPADGEPLYDHQKIAP